MNVPVPAVTPATQRPPALRPSPATGSAGSSRGQRVVTPCEGFFVEKSWSLDGEVSRECLFNLCPSCRR